MVPKEPVYGPLKQGSRESISSMALNFGHPLMVPPGSMARKIAGKSTLGFSRPSMVETRWWRWA